MKLKKTISCWIWYTNNPRRFKWKIENLSASLEWLSVVEEQQQQPDPHGFKSKIKVKEDTPVYSKKKDQNEWKSATLQVKPLENTAKPGIVNLNMVHAIHWFWQKHNLCTHFTNKNNPIQPNPEEIKY